MKFLITGNQGYIGPIVGQVLRRSFPCATLVGLDTGYFAHCLTAVEANADGAYDLQYRADLRDVNLSVLSGVDVVVHLAAISNDPMGAFVERQTEEINAHASEIFLRAAKAKGVKGIVFASSCSMYGASDDGVPRTESSPLNPLSAYARSKIYTEEVLGGLATPSFRATALRFSTACGMSPRLRLDLVLNDFVASAIASHRIEVLSDGDPWRPVIHVRDMARAIEWGVRRTLDGIGTAVDFQAVNVGRTEWNFQVRDIAHAVAETIPGVSVKINTNAQPDRRSYRVNFDLFKTLAPDHLPEYDLAASARDLAEGLWRMGFADQQFRQSRLVRLQVLRAHLEAGRLSNDLRWMV